MTAVAVRSVHLYDLGEAREILESWLAEAEGELLPEIAELLDALDVQSDVKIENVALFVRELLAHAEVVKAEAQRLAAKQKSLEKAAESLKAYLLRNMERLGKPRVDGRLVVVAVQANSVPSVTTPLKPDELYAVEAARPFVTRKETVVYTLEREKLLAAWKAGEPIPTCIAIEKGVHLRIR